VQEHCSNCVDLMWMRKSLTLQGCMRCVVPSFNSCGTYQAEHINHRQLVNQVYNEQSQVNLSLPLCTHCSPQPPTGLAAIASTVSLAFVRGG
jgi:hypothetical protein